MLKLMSGSLRDQLLKSGVASKQQAHKAKQAIKKTSKANKNARRNGNAVTESSKLGQEIARSEQQKAEKDRALNAARNAEREARELQHSVSQIIERNAIKTKGEDRYNFTLDNKIQHIYVDELQRKQLINGVIGIIEHGDTLYAIPAAVARRLAEKVASKIMLNDADNSASESDDAEDDPYAQYEVPDDLMW